jgi:hypothetical protein
MSALGASIILTVILIVIGILLIPTIFFLITLQGTLQRVRPENREMEPGLVWLNLIPIFNLGWQFFTIIKLTNSVRREYVSRGRPEPYDGFGFNLGIAYCICECCGIIPFFGILAGLAGLVLWIMYWVKIAGYKRELEFMEHAGPTPQAQWPTA